MIAAGALALVIAAAAGDGPVTGKKTLTLEGARKVVAAAVALARRNNAGGVIAVVGDGGDHVASLRMPPMRNLVF